MHVVEQSEFPVYDGIHEAIISEADWNLAKEKRPDSNWIRNIVFTFPVPIQGHEVKELPLEKSTLSRLPAIR